MNMNFSIAALVVMVKMVRGGGGTHAEISTVSGKDNSISGREGEDETSQQERDEEAAAAAAAASAAAETTGVGVEEGPAPGYEGTGWTRV